MTRFKRFACLFLALTMVLSLTACDLDKDALQEKLSDVIIHLATRFGFIGGEEGNEDEVRRVEARLGGEILFPEKFDPTDGRLVTLLEDGVLYVGWNGIRNRGTEYFVATGDSVTITAYATSTNTNAETPPRYKVALWMLSEDMTETSYVNGSTVYFFAGGESQCYTAVIAGLTPGRRYKMYTSYDTGTYTYSGGMTITGVSNEDLISFEGDAA